MEDFGALPYSENVNEEKFVIFSLPEMCGEAQEESGGVLDSQMKVCSLFAICHILLRFISMRKKNSTVSLDSSLDLQASSSDKNFKKFKKAFQTQKFDSHYLQQPEFTNKILGMRFRVPILRIRLKLQKIDMALRVVLKRNTRKNNINH